MDSSKRNSIKVLSAIGASSLLPGCALLNYLCPEYDLVDIGCANGTYPIVDAHAHFFNGTDLLAGQYLTGPVVNDLFAYANIEPIKTILALTGKVIQRIATTFALSARDELVFLSQKSITKDALANPNLFNYRDLEYKATSEAFYEALTQAERDEIQNAIALLEAERDQKLNAFGNKAIADKIPPIKFDENTLFNAVTDQSSELAGEEKGDLLALYAAYKILGLDTLFSFVLRMLSKRSTNLAEYQHVYSNANSNGAFVLNTTDITVDFDYWLGGCEKDYDSSIADQIAIHEKLHNLTNKYTIPLLGINPMKLVHQGPEYKSLIENTLSGKIDDRGNKIKIYRGVKIYPTHGFSPNGDLFPGYQNNIKLCSGATLPTEDEIKKALYDLYDICVANDAVVMAHSDKSKGHPQEAAAFGGPKYWSKVFENNSYKNLKVNFGHLGEFKKEDDSNWTDQFLKLMAEGNRYGDLGFWFTQGNEKQLTKLINAIQNTAGQDVFDRILYGTDWYMLTSKPNWKPYLNRAHKHFVKLIQDGMFPSQDQGNIAMNKFFYLNAKRLYGDAVTSCA